MTELDREWKSLCGKISPTILPQWVLYMWLQYLKEQCKVSGITKGKWRESMRAKRLKKWNVLDHLLALFKKSWDMINLECEELSTQGRTIVLWRTDSCGGFFRKFEGTSEYLTFYNFVVKWNNVILPRKITKKTVNIKVRRKFESCFRRCYSLVDDCRVERWRILTFWGVENDLLEVRDIWGQVATESLS